MWWEVVHLRTVRCARPTRVPQVFHGRGDAALVRFHSSGGVSGSTVTLSRLGGLGRLTGHWRTRASAGRHESRPRRPLRCVLQQFNTTRTKSSIGECSESSRSKRSSSRQKNQQRTHRSPTRCCSQMLDRCSSFLLTHEVLRGPAPSYLDPLTAAGHPSSVLVDCCLQNLQQQNSISKDVGDPSVVGLVGTATVTPIGRRWSVWLRGLPEDQGAHP